MNPKVQLTECPRDAMQGIKKFIPTATKINYLNQLLKVGFDQLDFGSFVSSKAIPQMSDTKEVVQELSISDTKLLAIIANERGAESAAMHSNINVIGFPFSISEQFQLRNTNSTRLQALERVKNIKKIAESQNIHCRVYLSMAFGNPYQEEWSPKILTYWAQHLEELGVNELVLSDTVGVADQTSIEKAFSALQKTIPKVQLGGHFHSNPENWKTKITGAKNSNCNSFDSAILGIGGCPMATDELVGNIATENLIDLFSTELSEKFNQTEFEKAQQMANLLFSNYH